MSLVLSRFRRRTSIRFAGKRSSRATTPNRRRRMKGKNYKQRALNNHVLHPETLMMGYGYSPALSEGALKPPVFLTSTFVFETAQQGKDLFDITSGRRRA